MRTLYPVNSSGLQTKLVDSMWCVVGTECLKLLVWVAHRAWPCEHTQPLALGREISLSREAETLANPLRTILEHMLPRGRSCSV